MSGFLPLTTRLKKPTDINAPLGLGPPPVPTAAIDPNKKPPPLGVTPPDFMAQNARIHQQYDPINTQLGGLQAARDQLGPAPTAAMIGRGIGSIDAPGVTTARSALDTQIGALDTKVGAFTPQFHDLAQRARAYTGTVQANRVLQGIPGATPVPLGVTRPPASAPASVPALPARPPASPASQAGASASPPAGGGAAPLQRPVAYGPGATFATDDGRLGQLPAGIAAVKQRNGVTAFGGTGASVAAATGQPYAPLGIAPPSAAPNLSVPGISLPSLDTQRVVDAQRERTALQSQIGSDLFALRGQPSSRGQREQIQALEAQRLGLITQSGSLAGDAANQNLQSATTAGVATQGQYGDTQRTLIGDANTRAIAAGVQQGENGRAVLDSHTKLNAPQTITDAAGNLVTINGAKAQQVFDAQGNLVKPDQAKADHPDANSILANYTTQRKALDDAAALTGTKADYTSLDQSLIGQAYRRTLAPLDRPTYPAPPADHIVKLRANPHWAHYFDNRYGPGASARYLKGGSQ